MTAHKVTKMIAESSSTTNEMLEDLITDITMHVVLQQVKINKKVNSLHPLSVFGLSKNMFIRSKDF